MLLLTGLSLRYPVVYRKVSYLCIIQSGLSQGFRALTGKPYGALVNIGYNPTVPTGGKRLLEAHLLDFSGDLYGRTISVELVVFLRPEQKFASLDELRERIEQDKTEIIKILETC